MDRKFKKIIHFTSFILLFFIALVLSLSLVVKSGKFIEIMQTISKYVAYVIVCLNAYLYVKTKRSSVFMLLYVIATIVILSCLIVNVF
ncbi:MAG: hypothetical protein ACI4T1_00070 [Christensenellales bacterium]